MLTSDAPFGVFILVQLPRNQKSPADQKGQAGLSFPSPPQRSKRALKNLLSIPYYMGPAAIKRDADGPHWQAVYPLEARHPDRVLRLLCHIREPRLSVWQRAVVFFGSIGLPGFPGLEGGVWASWSQRCSHLRFQVQGDSLGSCRRCRTGRGGRSGAQ